MNAREAGKLIGLMALYDNRKADDPADVVAWLKVVGDLRYADCDLAVVAHYKESTERIMPAHVRERVAILRRGRLEAAGHIAIPEELADRPLEAQAWLVQTRRAIADGQEPQRAIGGTP